MTKPPKIGQRGVNLQMAKGIVERAEESVETGEVARIMGLSIFATTQLLMDLERAHEISQIGYTRYGPNKIRWARYRPPKRIETPNFTPYRAPKPTIIPVRAGGTIATDIYQQSISLGGTDK
jgi:hypothetical protein